jgi:hypothetical protein
MKRFIFLIAIGTLFISCQTVPPSVIGSETRDKIDTLKTQTETIANQASAIDAGVDTVASDMTTLEAKIPDELKTEYHAIQTKIALVAGLTETHKAATVETVKEALEVKTSFEGDMTKTAVLAYEKAKAETKAAKSTGQRNVAWIILAVIGIAGGVLVWIKCKTGILGVVSKVSKLL